VSNAQRRRAQRGLMDDDALTLLHVGGPTKPGAAGCDSDAGAGPADALLCES
jgi:hypothetical protein